MQEFRQEFRQEFQRGDAPPKIRVTSVDVSDKQVKFPNERTHG
jgi:hypothetical protein